MKKLIFMLLATMSLTACTDPVEIKKSITLTDDTSNNQIINADETSRADAIKFSTTESWTATVKAITKASDDTKWLTLSPSSGGAGDFSISLSFSKNETKESRKSEINIICGKEEIAITIEQKGVTDPDKPDPDKNPLFITKDGKVTGGEILGKNAPNEIYVLIAILDSDQSIDLPIIPYANKAFAVTLPVPSSKVQGAFFTNVTVTPEDAKFSFAKLDYKDGYIVPTNISIENTENPEYKMKKDDARVIFVYASKDVVTNGTHAEYGDTHIFDNCKFNQGWNEMVVTITDIATNGSITYNITSNNATSAFRWAALHDEVAQPTRL